MANKLTAVCLFVLAFRVLPAAGANDNAALVFDRTLIGGTVAHFDLTPSQPKQSAPSFEEAEPITGLLNSVNETYSSVLTMPPVINVSVNKVVKGSSSLGLLGELMGRIPRARYEPASNLLVVGTQLGDDTGKLQTTEKSKSATIHEYGHAIFDRNLDRLTPENANRRALIQRLLETDTAIRTITLRTSSFTCDQITYVQPFLSKLERYETATDCGNLKGLEQTKQSISATLHQQTWAKKLAAYQELFADTLAVLETGNRDTVVEAFDFLKHVKANKELSPLRSFANCPSPKNLKLDDPHSYFSAARCEIGRHVHGRLTKDQKAQLLTRVFDVLSKDFMECRRMACSDNIVADNERLVRSLKIEFEGFDSTDGNISPRTLDRPEGTPINSRTVR